MITLPISLNNGRTKALASCTALLMALIPVFIFCPKFYLGMDRKTRKSVHPKFNQFCPISSIKPALAGLMKGVLSSLHQHFLRMRVAYVVLGASLVPAAVVYFRVRANVETRERARFERVVREE